MLDSKIAVHKILKHSVSSHPQTELEKVVDVISETLVSKKVPMADVACSDVIVRSDQSSS